MARNRYTLLMILLLILLCLAGCALCLHGERKGQMLLSGLAKTFASACFVGLAIHQGALDSHFGRLILLGLGLSMLGDVLLISKQRLLFLSGMAAFGAAHIAYSAGFLRAGPFTPSDWAIGGLASLAFCVLVMWKLWPQLLSQWKGPVIAYTLIIGAMVAIGIAGSFSGGLAIGFAVAAVGFAISDISVALDRLTAGEKRTRFWGLPLYYASQLAFAASL